MLALYDNQKVSNDASKMKGYPPACAKTTDANFEKISRLLNAMSSSSQSLPLPAKHLLEYLSGCRARRCWSG